MVSFKNLITIESRKEQVMAHEQVLEIFSDYV